MGGATVETFGTAPDGAEILLARLENGGSRVAVMSWGASLQDFRIAGFAAPLVLGSPDFATCLGPLKHCGAIVGRVANRIAKGRAPLAGRVITLERNERDRTTLHGGSAGSGLRNWRLADCDGQQAVLTLRLADGEGGFPGNLDIRATYALDTDGALTLTLDARTDAPTFCNLAHHGYWSFDPEDRLKTHLLTIEADHYLPVDADLIPLGTARAVAGTRFDFRTPRAVIRSGDARLDHNFCLRPGSGGLRPACRLERDALVLDIATDAPGLQIYEGAHLDTGTAPTHSGKAYRANAGLAIEPQHWPDAPNHPDFPDIRLDPGQTWQQNTRFHAYVRD